MDETQPHIRWQNIQDQDVTPQNVQDVLSIVDDDLWIVAACVDRLVDSVDAQRSLVELGIARTNSAVLRGQAAPQILTPDTNAIHGHNQAQLTMYFNDAPIDAKLCRLRAILLHRSDRLSSFVQIYKNISTETENVNEIDEEWEDDPWAEDGATNPPIRLSNFLAEDLLELACFFASQQQFSALRILMLCHSDTLWASRFAILDSIPPHTHPSEYHEILPAYDVHRNAEQIHPFSARRTEQDWVESPDVDAALKATQSHTHTEFDMYQLNEHASACTEPLGPKELTAWYKRRVDLVISSTGILDVALATVQHGASHGVPDLDELGEELSLLSRLVYDSPQPPEPQDNQDWSPARWRSMEPAEIVGAYLAHSTSETVAKDVMHLVMPYLFVLEARAERAGNPDPGLPTRLLYNHILSAPLPIVASIFEASKATLPVARRIIRNDEDVARLALACLYGSESRNEWSTMSSIFECLPAWEITPGIEDEADEADATVMSLGSFVVPSTTRTHCSPSDLMLFFKPLPLVSLSRALDILDVHLESGEILSRWNVGAPLRWFLQSANDESEQRARANRMARRTGNVNDMDGGDEWEWLLEDMLKLCGISETGIKNAFGLLSKDEVSSIFFAGLLSSGSFDIASELLQQKHGKLSLPPLIAEDICLSVSREFYDNASSGNYKTGDMKLAYDCLAVPPPSERLTKERDFIEATSRLSSFNILSRPGVPLTPIEIRLTKDRLSLISRVLSSTPDAYKHTEVILDLLYKLGFRGDVVAEVWILAMLSDTALQAEDFSRAYETSKRMIDKVSKLSAETPSGTEDKAVREASDVCWVACFQLGRHSEFQDVEAKFSLLAHALQLCPADRIHDVLTSWRRLEKDDIESRREYLTTRTVTRSKRTVSSDKRVPSLRERLGKLHMPTTPLINAEDAAALAGRAFNRMASNFTIAVTGRGRSDSPAEEIRSRSRDGTRGMFDGEEVSTQASRVLQKGIGWLLGAGDDI